VASEVCARDAAEDRLHGQKKEGERIHCSARVRRRCDPLVTPVVATNASAPQYQKGGGACVHHNGRGESFGTRFLK